MAEEKKRPVNKTDPAKTSRRMAGVRPIRGKSSVAAPYDPGFKEPPAQKSPWVDEGRPETAG